MILSNATVVAWLLLYARWREQQEVAKATFVPISYNRLQRWFQKAAQALGFGSVRWTSHSLRWGGATELYRQNMPFKDLQQFGRWLSDRSTREYIRRGEVSLTRFNTGISEAAWARAHALASVGVRVWSLE